MRILKVEISNWRSIKSVVVEFEEIMIFIGQNNHGKSNILSALLFFFGQINNDVLDYNDKTKDIYVEVTFSDLDDNDKTTFKKYLTSKKQIRVRKTANTSGGIEYRGYSEIPNELWLKEENIGDYLKREEAEKLPLKNHLPPNGRITKELFKKAQDQYIEENKNSIELSYQLETSNFLGFKNVAKGIFGDVFYIPSVKKAVDELTVKGNSTFSQLYSTVIRRMSEENSVYKDAKSTIVNLTKLLNKKLDDGTTNTQRPTELSDLENKLEQELKSWDTKVDIEITPPNIEDIFRLGAEVWVDDGIRTDIERKGHGLQRAIIFALIKSLAKIIDERKSKEREEIAAQNQEDLEAKSRQVSKSTYFILEEPELYLHPQAQRALFNSLVSLTNENNQIILCTHSSSFLDLDLYKSICIVKKESISEGTKVFQFTGNIFEQTEDAKKFNLIYWINPDRSELFFAKKVILLEGQTDKSIIPYLAKKLDVFRFDYTVIDCGSKDNMPIYVNLLNKFKINYVAAYDKDHQAYKDTNGKNSADKSSRKIEESIDNSLGLSIIFNNDIEEEIGLMEKADKNKPYTAIQCLESADFIVSKELIKKIKTIYS